ncbi:glutathione S-transferase family protein [Sphingomonas sp. HITSZ_GF]|uniref:glutathione S-transferase family protein n=1 Tax=Sphingomonas sp. HITSZ_GF TaxID=3037247 RepID=UPI00240DD67F|nr:glutathione S-transferase family protein [Sphingomonas sp. HITSZ_GF]MDG2532496.1 glutathione S-transferase family protein [Sphingomonas sp. HITSZ_GF]
MPLQLFGHPFSSYTWKALIAFYENGIPFTFRNLEEPGAAEELEARWPLKLFPVLAEDDRTVVEATAVIEYLHVHHPGPVPLIPADADLAVQVRMLDRIFDNYVMGAMQVPVADALRPEERRDPAGIDEAKARLDKIYAWLDAHLAGRKWAVGSRFSLADCAAAPSLFYADWVHRIPEQYANLRAYRARLLARPSVSRCVEEARPYRGYFPLGAPDRD